MSSRHIISELSTSLLGRMFIAVILTVALTLSRLLQRESFWRARNASWYVFLTSTEYYFVLFSCTKLSWTLWLSTNGSWSNKVLAVPLCRPEWPAMGSSGSTSTRATWFWWWFFVRIISCLLWPLKIFSYICIHNQYLITLKSIYLWSEHI